VTGAGTGVGVPGVGVPGVGEGVGAPGAPPPEVEPGPEPRPEADAGPLETKIGVNPVKTDGAMGRLTTPCCAGETSTGTLRTWVLGTASSRATEGSSALKACIHSWADATAPAATAPT
jgi:hypothetical protein